MPGSITINDVASQLWTLAAKARDTQVLVVTRDPRPMKQSGTPDDPDDAYTYKTTLKLGMLGEDSISRDSIQGTPSGLTLRTGTHVERRDYEEWRAVKQDITLSNLDTYHVWRWIHREHCPDMDSLVHGVPTGISSTLVGVLFGNHVADYFGAEGFSPDMAYVDGLEKLGAVPPANLLAIRNARMLDIQRRVLHDLEYHVCMGTYLGEMLQTVQKRCRLQRADDRSLERQLQEQLEQAQQKTKRKLAEALRHGMHKLGDMPGHAKGVSIDVGSYITTLCTQYKIELPESES